VHTTCQNVLNQPLKTGHIENISVKKRRDHWWNDTAQRPR
jgi:hypothetical protein